MHKIKMFRQSCASHLGKECLNFYLTFQLQGFCALQRRCLEILLSSKDLMVYEGVGPVSAYLQKKKNLENNSKVSAAILRLASTCGLNSTRFHDLLLV